MKINLKNKSLFINGGRPYRKKKWLNNVTTKPVIRPATSAGYKYLIT